MCGIAGFWRNSNNQPTDWLHGAASAMSEALTHRGPDDSGIWVDAEVGIAFGHRRLSIIDTSAAGHQPMVSSDGRFVIIYNGEIYNFQELRQNLKKLGHQFRGHSDTEVMLSCFVEWGVRRSLKRFNGMFAFAIRDRRDRLLWLARDRIGEKPLYYGVQNGTFFFGSELKAIRSHPEFKPEIDLDSLSSFLRFSYVPAPYSIYTGINKLLPGHFLRMESPKSVMIPQTYWSLEQVYRQGIAEPFKGSEYDATDELEGRLKKTVKSRMVSDVPLGAFLSGGIDSSTIVALMQTQAEKPVNTFTIGFHEQKFNEAIYAKRVAKHLGTNHTEMYVTPKEAMNVIPKLASMYDEPFADSSQIPTHLISKIARNHVKVVLSGDGGDELFVGYNRYLYAKRYWTLIKYLPRKLINQIMNLGGGLEPEIIERLYNKIDPFLPIGMKVSMPVEKYQKLVWALRNSSSPRGIYNRVVSLIQDPNSLLLNGQDLPTQKNIENIWREFQNPVLNMVYSDLMTYHPDDILQKVDRASMAVSLETRVPFLDHNFVEFVMALPLKFKLKNGEGKYLLRKILYKHIPKKMMERPKMGFSVPLNQWLRGELNDWGRNLIESNRLNREGYFKSEMIMNLWKQHEDGKANWGHELWNVLMFQAWLEEQ